MTRADHVESYHMTRAQAEYLAGTDPSYRAKPYPDRHGDHTNNFTPNLSTWGVWSKGGECWVFAHTLYWPV